MLDEKWAVRWRRVHYLLLFIAILVLYLLIVYCVHPSKKATLLIGGFGAFFQTVIAISAIWGNQIRALFLGPNLELSLDRKEGQLTHFQDDQPARFFHLRVHNKRPGSLATRTQVILYSIVRPHKEGDPEPLSINGRLPFPWKFRGANPHPKIRLLDAIRYMESERYSVIGPDDYCDLACLTSPKDSDGNHPAEPARLILRAEGWMLVKKYLDIKSGEKTTVEAVAIAENATSNILTLDISWDGKWPGEMDNHVTDHVKIDVVKPRLKRKRKQH